MICSMRTKEEFGFVYHIVKRVGPPSVERTKVLSDLLRTKVRKVHSNLGCYILGDFDNWTKPCEKCGHDNGKTTQHKCWKCGGPLQRDYSARALKANRRKP